MSSATTQQSGDESSSEEEEDMALLSLQPPAVFLECPGEPKLAFATWKKLFDNYLLAIGGDGFSAGRKRALLIHCLGTEGNRIYCTLPLETDDYDGSVKALETYFSPKLNVVAERYRFRQRAQVVGESTDHYVAALRELVKNCQFGAMEKAEHEANLRAVLCRINDAGLKLNVDKCHIRQTTLSFLGQKIGPEGLLPDDSHVAAILNAPPPSDPATLRSFLGLSAWYSKFVPNYATVVEPMRALLRKDCAFHWNKTAQTAFDQVKQLIVQSTALVLFDPNKPTIVSTDASDYGIGAVLTQLDSSGEEQTVAFASRSLSDAERKYSIVEKEALACIWAAEKWRTWLWGRKFLLRTDHQALTTLLTTKGNNRAGLRIARWSARLLEFDYDVEYRSGSLNHVADCLSRLPLPETDTACAAEVESVVAILTDLNAVSEDDFRSECKNCPVLTKLRVQIQKGWPSRQSILESDLQPYFPMRHELSVMNECIIRGPHRLLVPESLQKRLIVIAHETHQGIVRTKQRLRELYWWPKMDLQIETFIKNCSTCKQNDKTSVTHDAPLQPVPLPAAAWEKVSVDIIGPFETAPSDCRFAISLVDNFSKWPEVAFASRVDTATIIQFLTAVFSREENPKTLISDNGPQFLSSEFAVFLKEHGIQHLRSSVYYPRANGEVERFNRCVKDCLQTASIQGEPWKSFLRTYLRDYRATPHSTTGVSLRNCSMAGE
ncbi:hypothetical protein WMY93_030544 [Mugilogobius chulae]|uniref:Gypsy retrotransposon integrase-like protein 1 n=1 Tax=Mugilogobius chulae TaxID=88201 RepID=A0AAW0MDX8_9GOBI